MMGDETVDFLTMLGYLDLAHGKGEQAVPLFEALQVLVPHDVRIATSLAYAYLQAGQWEACLRQADRTLEMHPEAALAQNVRLIRGRALWRLDRQREALASLNAESPAASPATAILSQQSCQTLESA